MNDSRSISCPRYVLAGQVATLVAKFNGGNDVLQITASAHGAISNVSDRNGGAEESLLALADRDRSEPLGDVLGGDRAVQAGRSRRPPMTRGNINANDANLPISVELWCGNLTPAG